MKKTLIYSLATLFLAGLMVFQSCTGTETAEPVVVVSSTDAGWDASTNTFTGEVGDTLELLISVTADGIFNTMRVTKADGSTVLEKTRTVDGQTSFSTTLKYGLISDEVGKSVELTIAGIDDEQKSSEETVTIITEAAAIPVVKYTAKLLYVPLAENTTTKTWFSTDNGNTYSRDDVEKTADPVSPLIDFGYYNGVTNKASIASPAQYPAAFQNISSWSTKNKTLLKTTEMAADHFGMIVDNTTLANHWAMTDMADADGDVINLNVDDIVAFELDAAKGSKKGFFIVKSIVGTFNSGDYIEIEVVVEGEE